MGYTMGRFPADFKGTFRNERNEFVIQYFHHQGREFYHVGSFVFVFRPFSLTSITCRCLLFNWAVIENRNVFPG